MDEITFASQSGPLLVKKRDDLMLMNFPTNMPSVIDTPEQLVQALGRQQKEVL